MVEDEAISALQQDVKFVTLGDGRRLAYTEYGAPAGKAVLCCHGHPGSRLDGGLINGEAVDRHGLRLIVPDRPGIGRSEFQEGRRIIDWPADAAQLADGLGIEEFTVLGVSCGGPFAAAMAFALPERVTKLVLVSSVGRFDIHGATQGMGSGLMYFRLGRYAPWLARVMVGMMAKGLKSDREKMVAQVKAGLPPADAALFEDPLLLQTFLDTLGEFLRQEAGHMAWEAGLFMRDWGFPVEQIRVPATLWHGEEDRNAPAAMGRDLAGRIPGCEARFAAGEGHFSLLVSRIDEILGALAQA